MSKYEVFKNNYDEYCVIFKGRNMPSGDLGFNSRKKANIMIDWLNKNPNSNIREMDEIARKIKGDKK